MNVDKVIAPNLERTIELLKDRIRDLEDRVTELENRLSNLQPSYTQVEREQAPAI